MEEKRTIFFDWDGTLQSKKVSEYANIKRTQIFAEDLSEDEIIEKQRNSHNDHYAFIQEKMRKKYYIKYVQENKEKILLFNKEKFREFKEKNNLRFVIVTSLYEVTIKTVLKINELDDLFEVYGCSVDLRESKQENLQRALENNQDSNPLMMIGDRGEDIEAGKYHNLKTIYCNYGHGNDDYGADKTIDNPEELISTIQLLLL